MTCSLPLTLPPCCLTLTLSGTAKEGHVKMYFHNVMALHSILQVYKLEGSDDKYLFLNSEKFNLSWIVWSSLDSSLKGEEGFFAEAS